MAGEEQFHLACQIVAINEMFEGIALRYSTQEQFHLACQIVAINEMFGEGIALRYC